MNVQASWVTMGRASGQVALAFGANDLGSTMIEENVVAAAGCVHRASPELLRRLIARPGSSRASGTRGTSWWTLRRGGSNARLCAAGLLTCRAEAA